jgi:uncharacterized membrane protein
VVLIHFPIALFIVGVAFDFLAQWDELANSGGSGVLQFAGCGGFHLAGFDHRVAGVAVEARGGAAGIALVALTGASRRIPQWCEHA